jgi:hypothetical protein
VDTELSVGLTDPDTVNGVTMLALYIVVVGVVS